MIWLRSLPGVDRYPPQGGFFIEAPQAFGASRDREGRTGELLETASEHREYMKCVRVSALMEKFEIFVESTLQK
jgi:hypothetical protein